MSQTPTSPDAAPTSGLQLPQYEVEQWAVERLKVYERNARKHSPQQVRQIKDSIHKFGQVWPILVRVDGTIIAGHGRLEAAKSLGLTEVRVIVANGWSEEQCRAFGILDNKVALNSEWDETLLAAELADLSGFGVDLSMLGFDPTESEELLAPEGTQGNTDPDETLEPPVVPVSRAGDVWLLGRHRILCGDSTKAEDVSRVLGAVKPHLMVTDPPYGVEYSASWRNDALGGKENGRATGKVANDDKADWREAWKLFPGDVAYVWHADKFSPVVAESLQACDFEMRNLIIWGKSQLVIGRGNYHSKHEPCWYAVRAKKKAHWSGDRKQTTLWDIAKPAKSETGHGTQKPVECMKRPIENNSSPGQAIYEPFSGSGTTIIACEITGRTAHAIEINPAYVDVAVKRWQEFTGERAKLEGDGRDFEAVAAERLPKAA